MDKKMQQWEKWHNSGYKKFMLINMAGVCAFYAFSATIAFTQLIMTMPKSVKEKGGAIPIFAFGFLILGLLIVAAFFFMHFTWKSKEKKYAEYKQVETPEEETEN